MGRRALPKIDPTLDLSRHLLTLTELEPPFVASRWFGREAPLEIEVGSGKGLFLTAAAANDPTHNFVGVEIGAKYARFAASRLARRGLNNACMISGDALRFMREFIANDSVAAVHVYFPDPWWKKRHRKRRVMNEGLVADVQRCLVPGGRLHFWTDVEEYFQVTLELLASATRLSGPHPVSERPAEHDLDYRTHFERRMRMHGLPVYRAEFIKPPAGAVQSAANGPAANGPVASDAPETGPPATHSTSTNATNANSSDTNSAGTGTGIPS